MLWHPQKEELDKQAKAMLCLLEEEYDFAP